MNLLRQILSPEAPDSGTRWRMFLTNCIAVSLGIITLPYAALFAWLNIPWLAVLVVPIAAFYLAAPLTMRLLGFTTLRASFFALFGTVVSLYAMGLGEGAGIQLLYFAAICLPLVVCRLDERALIGFGIGWPIAAWTTLELTNFELLGPSGVETATQAWIHAALIPTTILMVLVEVFYFAATTATAQAQVAAQNTNLQGLLDNLEEGVVPLGEDGAVLDGRSAVIDAWFNPPVVGEASSAWLSRMDANFATWFSLGLEAVQEGALPTDLALDQMPSALTLGGRHLRARVRPIGSGPPFTKLLLVFTDVTAEVEAERARAAQQELIETFTRIQRDRSGFLSFVRETSGTLAELAGGRLDGVAAARALHTVKGNASIMGLRSFSSIVHHIEDEAAELGSIPVDGGARCLAAWEAELSRLSPWIQEDDRLVIARADLLRARDRLAQGSPPAEILAILSAWCREPAEARLSVLGEQASALAERLGKRIQVEVDAAGVRLDPARMGPVWAALVHLVRNAVDHGIEAPEVRIGAGKEPEGRLRLAAAVDPDGVTLTITDDGAGVDWASVAHKARARGLPADTHDDLVDALFTDGLSTRETATDVSGRGVGLAALRAAVHDLGGVIEVRSVTARGTCFELRLPEAQPARLAAA